MKIAQKWVGWASRSYEQIKRSALDRLVASNPELTDHSESSPLVILIDIFAGIAEVQIGRASCRERVSSPV